jgi:1-deoxy-D-xylulose-5-phosphate synthase
MALGGIVPNLQMAAPRDSDTLREELREAVQVTDAPTLIRFPKGEVIESVPAIRRENGLDILLEGTDKSLIDYLCRRNGEISGRYGKVSWSNGGWIHVG